MKEFIEKLIGRLEEYKYSHLVERDSEQCKHCVEKGYEECEGLDCVLCVWDKAIFIANQLAEEYKGGWIPCSNAVPQDGDWVLCYGTNREGRIKYEVSTYAHEIQCWMCSRIEDVIAWQPLPEPYHPKGE